MHRIWSISPLFYLVKNAISNVKNWQKSSKCLQSRARNISRDKRLDKGTRRRLSIGRESVANSNDVKITSISRFKRRSIRKSRAWNFFFFFDDRNWIFRVFESVAIRFVPRCQRPTKLCQVNDWTRSILALEGKNKGEEGEGLIECYYRCVILKGELEAEAWKN